MILNQKTPIARVSSPPVKTTKVGLDIIKEKIPPTPNHRKMVDPDGHVKRLVLSTARTIGRTADNTYHVQKFAEKIAAGWLPYAECPYARGYARLPDGERPCEGIDPSVPGIFYRPHPTVKWAMIEDECCPHVEDAIKKRQARYNARQKEIADQFTGSQDKLVQLLEAHAKKEMEAAAKRTSALEQINDDETESAPSTGLPSL